MGTPQRTNHAADAARRHLGLLAVFLACAAAAGLALARKPDKDAALTARDAQSLVDAHNAIRAGVRKPSGYPGAWTPIPPLAWSEELASGAQEWADHLRESNDCKLVHSDARLGENLAGGKQLDIAGAVKLWENEGGRYRWTPVYAWEIPTGHYTQVVWRKTTQIGCGRAICGSRVVLVCRYSPPGNHIGKAPY